MSPVKLTPDQMHEQNTLRFDAIELDLRSQSLILTTLVETINTARGGLRMLVLLGKLSVGIAIIWGAVLAIWRHQ